MDAVGPYGMFMAGQFSEVEGMGRPVARDRAFAAVSERFDALTGGAFSIWVTEAPQAFLSEHAVASEAVVLFDAALGLTARERFGPPALVAGYSLGFYPAAVLAGVFSVEVAREWIHRTNEAMARAFAPGEFSLAVSIGLDRTELEGVLGATGFPGLEVANINNARQMVFAGPSAGVEASLAALQGRALSAKAIPLGFPLHTTHLLPVVAELEPWWRSLPLSDPVLPLLSPVDGAALRSGAGVREAMLASLVAPTDWVAVVRSAGSAGLSFALDTSGDGSLGRMTTWVDRSLRLISYRDLLGGESGREEGEAGSGEGRR